MLLFLAVFFIFYLLGPSFFAECAQAQQITFVLKILQELPELSISNKVLDILVFQVIARSWQPCKIEQCLVYKATLEQVVRAMHLGICLLQDHHPDLIVNASCEDGATVWLARKEVVDSDFNPLSAFANLYPVYSLRVPLLGDEQPFDQRWSLCQQAYGTQEVVILESAMLAPLLYVTWLNWVIEDMNQIFLICSEIELCSHMVKSLFWICQFV